MWPFRKRRYIPRVIAREIPLGPIEPCSPTCVAMVGILTDDTQYSGEFIGPKMAPIRWWQIWRWHLRREYQRQCEEAYRKLEEFLGTPKPPEDSQCLLPDAYSYAVTRAKGAECIETPTPSSSGTESTS